VMSTILSAQSGIWSAVHEVAMGMLQRQQGEISR